MTMPTVTAFWHKASYDQFMRERLPQLLAERLPLADYRFEATDPYACCVVVAVNAGSEPVEVVYADLPQPDAEGIFCVQGGMHTVVPLADHSDLDTAVIKCVGEQWYDLVAARLGHAPTGLIWDPALLRAWFPLDKWLAEFMQTNPYWQWLDETNWLARQTHLRRLYITQRTAITTPGQFGRVCPFEMPEGPNLGRIASIALGAAIRNGQLVIKDNAASAHLGLSASMIPCLEHNDPLNLLMAANMMRQWLPYADPEPALVQTGNEPDAPDFWCGRNLLTAFLPWGVDTYECGIVLSATGAKHLSAADHLVEPGDKLSNRHGVKGVISRILPDAQMPRLVDGTPVEIIFSSGSQHVKMNFGQVREALLGMLARAEGVPVMAPPFHAPDDATIRQRLEQVGLPTNGLATVVNVAMDEPLAQTCAAGWVYWGRTVHVAGEKLNSSIDRTKPGQRQGEIEFQTLRKLGAFATILEHFNTRSSGREAEAAAPETLVQRTLTSTVEQAGPPTPRIALLQRRLAAAGIAMTLVGEQVRLGFCPPSDPALQLAQPVIHPWLRDRTLVAVGAFPAATDQNAMWPDWQGERHESQATPFVPMPEYMAVVEANGKVARLLKSQAPRTLIEQASTQLERAVQVYLDQLLNAADLRFGSRVLFSGRAVLAPGAGLRFDQVGLAEELAWVLFGPMLTRLVGDAEAVRLRTESVTRQLDALMAHSWVILNHPLSFTSTSFLAFRPVRDPGHVVRLHPLACRLLDADFDGDQVSVFLPITALGQQEAASHLSLTAYLARDPTLLRLLAPWTEAMWGLACLSLQQTGRAEIEQLLGCKVNTVQGMVTQATLLEALQGVLTDAGAAQTLARLDQLLQRGFAMAQRRGLAIAPLSDAGVSRAALPTGDDATTWANAAEQWAEQLAASTTDAEEYGPYLLMIKSGARGQIGGLARLLGVQGVVKDVHGAATVIRHGYRDGLQAHELFALVPSMREQLAHYNLQHEQSNVVPTEHGPQSFNVLARARRAEHPGIVFARAAAIGEIDPLVDVESRLFVGLSPERGG